MQLPFSRLRPAEPEPALRVPAVPRRRGWYAALAVTALLAAVLASQRWWLAPLVVHRLATSSGRSVHIGALWVGLSVELQPVLRFRDVDIGNAPWAAHHEPLAVIGSGAAFVSWRSLVDGRPVIERLVLHDARIDMERLADGRRNWRLSDQDNRGPGRYRILALEADRSSLHFLHRGIDLDLDIVSVPNAPETGVQSEAAETRGRAGTTAPGEAAAAAWPQHLTLHGRWRRLPFTATVDTGAELTFRETGRSAGFRGELLAGGARLHADGRAGDLFLEPIADAHVEVAGDKLGPLRAFFGGQPDDATPLRPYRLTGHFTAARQAYGLTEAAARIGSTDLTGEVGIVRGEPRSRVSAKLQSRSTSLDDLTWLAGGGAAAGWMPPRPVRVDTSPAVSEAASSVAGVPASSGAAMSSERARTAPASTQKMDADIHFEARRFEAFAWPAIDSLKFGGLLEDGVFSLPQFDVGIGGGHATGSFSLDTRGAPAPAQLQLAWRDIRLEAFMREPAAKQRVRGALNGQLRLGAAGASTEALLKSASGSGSAMLADGHISSLLDAEVGLQGGKILRGLIHGPEQIAVRCAAASADVRDGAATLQSLVLDTERTHLTGSGRIDLARNTLDITLTPQPKERGLLDLDRSIRIHGALKKPEHELVARRAPTQAACHPG